MGLLGSVTGLGEEEKIFLRQLIASVTLGLLASDASDRSIFLSVSYRRALI